MHRKQPTPTYCSRKHSKIRRSIIATCTNVYGCHAMQLRREHFLLRLPLSSPFYFSRCSFFCFTIIPPSICQLFPPFCRSSTTWLKYSTQGHHINFFYLTCNCNAPPCITAIYIYIYIYKTIFMEGYATQKFQTNLNLFLIM
jgi:hypothetical protein